LLKLLGTRILPHFPDTELRLIEPGRVSWDPRRIFPAEYKWEAEAMLHAPGVTGNQIAAEMGMGATVLGHGRRELRRELARVTAEPARIWIEPFNVRSHFKQELKT
jgi:transposase-like protein